MGQSSLLTILKPRVKVRTEKNIFREERKSDYYPTFF